MDKCITLPKATCGHRNESHLGEACIVEQRTVPVNRGHQTRERDMTRKTIAVPFVALLLCWVSAVQGAGDNTARDARMKWWREARFGMFIHWGVYSVPAGRW